MDIRMVRRSDRTSYRDATAHLKRNRLKGRFLWLVIIVNDSKPTDRQWSWRCNWQYNWQNGIFCNWQGEKQSTSCHHWQRISISLTVNRTKQNTKTKTKEKLCANFYSSAGEKFHSLKQIKREFLAFP